MRSESSLLLRHSTIVSHTATTRRVFREIAFYTTMDQFISALGAADPFESWWPILVAVGIGILGAIHAYMGGQPCPSTNDIPGHVVIVTGASGGIGFEIARELCARKAKVIMACRCLQKAREAKKRIQKSVPGADVEVRQLDMASFENVRNFVGDIQLDFRQIDALVNNAGIIFDTSGETVDGFERHLQVNYLSCVLLVELLRPQLDIAAQSGSGRVVNTAAHAYDSAKIDAEDPLNVGRWRRTFHKRDAFAHSKALLVMWTRHMGMCTGADTAFQMWSYTPGFVRGTEHLRNSPIMNSICARLMAYPWMFLLMKSPTQAAQTAIYLVTEPSLRGRSGEFFNDCESCEMSPVVCENETANKLNTETRRVLHMI